MHYDAQQQKTERANQNSSPFDFLNRNAGEQIRERPAALSKRSAHSWQYKAQFQQTDVLERDILQRHIQQCMGNLGGVDDIFDDQYYQSSQAKKQPELAASSDLKNHFGTLAQPSTLPEKQPGQQSNQLLTPLGKVDPI